MYKCWLREGRGDTHTYLYIYKYKKLMHTCLGWKSVDTVSAIRQSHTYHADRGKCKNLTIHISYAHVHGQY